MGVVLRDAVDGLLGLEPGSVDMVCSDLPSGETMASFDEKADLSRLWPAVWMALKPDGVVALMAHSLPFATEVYASQKSYFRYELVWRKSIATGFLNARSRPLRIHEYVLIFWRGHRPTYEPQMVEVGRPIHDCVRTSHGRNYGALSQATRSRKGATDRYPTSVIDYASVGTTSPERVHPQQKPRDLLANLIATYTRPGELVVDPYAGSGACEKAALSLGRRCVCFDNSLEFAE